MSTDNNIQAKTVQFIDQAFGLLEQTHQEKQAAAAKAPVVVDALIERGLADPMQKDAMVRKFSTDPTFAMDALMKIASRVPPPSMGAPHNGRDTQRRNGGHRKQARESDLAFLRGLNIEHLADQDTE